MVFRMFKILRYIQRRNASTIDFCDLMNRNQEMGKFKQSPVPLFYCTVYQRSPEILELEKKPWKEMTIKEMRQIYHSYFYWSAKKINVDDIKDPFRDWRYVMLLAPVMFVVMNLFCDYLVRLWDFYIVHDAFARSFEDLKMRKIVEQYGFLHDNPDFRTPLAPLIPWELRTVYKNSYSDRSVFNPIKWFRDEEKALALKKKLEEDESK
ncbi:hypothetical protein RF11_07053 [Thelohanellus kitauei]|uniref:Uncharacterized protein n=1 Tax=Thelohanellus kitauei TaxID=669202 RepID=A0A0C2JSR3_THEKT|nr:hypothetical protein RF11_07053 [Thelohanellus kitauei]